MNYTGNDIGVQLRESMKYKRKGTIISIFKNMFSSINNYSSLSIIFDYIGTTFSVDDLWFMDKIYPKLYKIAKRTLYWNDFIGMEKYLLEKYSLYGAYGGETILTSFEGRISLGDVEVKGRVYLTKYRIIAHGKSGPTTGAAMMWAGAMSSSSGGGGSGSGIAIAYGVAKSIQKKIQKTMATKFDNVKPCYGYQYPYADAYRIQLTTKAVKYHVDLEIEKKYKVKNKTLKIKVVPKENIRENLSILKDRIDMVPVSLISSSIQFCPECGEKIIGTGQNFCTKCGLDLKNLPE